MVYVLYLLNVKGRIMIMDSLLIIIVVICGVEVFKKDILYIFYIVEELVLEVECCVVVGVSIIYLYVCENDGIFS